MVNCAGKLIENRNVFRFIQGPFSYKFTSFSRVLPTSRDKTEKAWAGLFETGLR